MIQITAQSKSLVAKSSLIAASLFLTTLLPVTSHVFSFATPLAHAQSVRTMTVVQLELNPGEKAEGNMKIINDSDEALNLSVLMQDFVVDNKNSIPNILPPDTLSNKYSASAWIGIDQMGFALPAAKVQQLHYYVQVPKNARPGGHYAATVFSPAANAKGEGSGAVINAQVGTLFYITVKGPITQNAKIAQFSAPGFSEYGPVKVTTDIKNNSDIHIQPNGLITVKNMFGQTKEKIALTGKNIFPEAMREFVSETGKNSFMIGRYTATLNAYYGSNHDLPLVATVAFWVFPWKIAVVILLALIAVILGYLAIKKRTTDLPDEPKRPITSEGSHEQNTEEVTTPDTTTSH
jgi:hypothetical protein